MRFVLLFTVLLFSNLVIASPPFLSLSSQFKKVERSPDSEVAKKRQEKDLRFTDEENEKDAQLDKPISAIPQTDIQEDESVKEVYFGTIQFATNEPVTDKEFQALTEKIKKGFLETSKDRKLKEKTEKMASHSKSNHSLANAQEIMNTQRKKKHRRAVAADLEGVSRGSEFIFHSMCQHIDSYEKNNAIDLGTSICPGK